MKVNLRDVVPEDAIRQEIESMVAKFLDRVITIDFTYQGAPKPARRPLPETPIVCPECGQDDFTTLQALGGHRFHKHGVAHNGNNGD